MSALTRVARTVTGLALIVALIGGCGRKDTTGGSGDGAIASLSSSTTSTRFVHEYWLKEAEQKSAIWDSALAICSPYWQHQDGTRPNCGFVYTARFYHAGATAPVRAKSMSVDSLRP